MGAGRDGGDGLRKKGRQEQHVGRAARSGQGVVDPPGRRVALLQPPVADAQSRALGILRGPGQAPGDLEQIREAVDRRQLYAGIEQQTEFDRWLIVHVSLAPLMLSVTPLRLPARLANHDRTQDLKHLPRSWT